MSETSRPATAGDLKRLMAALNASGARYLLIGAYALFAHGYQRATTDIDLLVEASVDNGRLVRQALLVLADQSARDIDPAWFTQGDNIRVADEITVDLLFSPCAQTYEMLLPHRQVVDLDGVSVNTVSLEGLLLTKQTQRPQDIQDSVVLRRAIAAKDRP
jgi:predicted nucleotidyltransferase